MDALKIPEAHKAYIEYYLGLPDEVKREIVNKVKDSEVGSMPTALANRLHSELNLPADKLRDVLSILFSLVSTQQKLNLSDSDFVEVLQNTYDESDITEFSKNDFVSGLSHLVTAKGENSTATGRVIELLQDNQNIFLSAVINSDIRPVFINGVDEVKNAVVIHNLKISYQSSGKDKDVYFALDGADLQMLKEVVVLAERRVKAMEAIAQVSLVELK
jgi:hypothetical protein